MEFKVVKVGAAAIGALLVLASAGSALGAQIFSEDFSGATPGTYTGGAIPGTQVSVTNANVDVVGVLNGSYFSCVDDPSGNCLDLVGNTGGGGIQSVPTFNLKAGRTYTLTFGEVLQGYSPGSSATTSVQISLGSLSQTEVYAGGVVTQETLTFSPLVDQNNAELSFNTLIPADSVHGAVIDNIVLTSTGGVPEPAAWIMMLIGMGSLGGVLRGNRARLAI